MMKNYLLLIALFATSKVFSQEVYLNAGNNFTKYTYKNSSGQSDLNIQSGTGNFYEIGLAKPFINKNLSYSVGLSWNEYNAIGNNSLSTYSWNTQYMGLHGGLSYSFFPKRDLDFLLKAGLNGATIIYGKQEIDGVYYDLIHQEEFSGMILESSIGFQIKYNVSSFGFLTVGYNYCTSTNITNTSKEKLSFNTNQLQMGIHFAIK
jgi:hypothetical protein